MNAFGIILAIVIYLGVMLYIGFRFSNNNDNADSFYLGGRKLGPFATAMSAEASDMSSWLLMGLPGVAYLTGIADAVWIALGLAVGTYLNWLFIARRIRRYTEQLDAITVPSFFSRRFHDKKNFLTLISALWIVVFFIPYTASGFAACGKLFGSLFGVNYHMAMIISAVVIIAYTAMGGFQAVSITDLTQSIVMSIALLIILGFGIHSAGGIGNVIHNAAALPGYLKLTSIFDPAANAAVPYSLLTIFSSLAWGLGYFGMPHILLRFMAISDEKKLVVSRQIGTVWVLISMGVSIFIGIVGLAASKAGAIPMLAGSDSETIIVRFASLLSSHGLLPALVAGLVLAGILASTMSTADSQLLAASSSVSKDLLQDVFHIRIDAEKTLKISRITLFMIALIAIVFAWDQSSSVFRIVSFAWAGFGASFGPVILLALFWKRANKYGALAGMVSGGMMVFLWKFLIAPMGGVLAIYELLPAFLTGLLVNVLVSLLTPKPEAEIEAEFERACKRV